MHSYSSMVFIPSCRAMVLILVLMEDALVQVMIGVGPMLQGVLILVLMEDALVRNKPSGVHPTILES